MQASTTFFQWIKDLSRCRRFSGQGTVAGLVLLACLLPSCREKAPYEGKNVSELVTMLKSPDPVTQVRGAYGLGLMGAQARPAVPVLIETLQNQNAFVRHNVALALGKLGPEAKDAVPALIQTLGDKEWKVRRQAALALGEMGPDANAAIGDLQRLNQQDVPLVRRAAEAALAKVDPAHFTAKTE
jgi:HEAT repeat protein